MTISMNSHFLAKQIEEVKEQIHEVKEESKSEFKLIREGLKEAKSEAKDIRAEIAMGFSRVNRGLGSLELRQTKQLAKNDLCQLAGMASMMYLSRSR